MIKIAFCDDDLSVLRELGALMDKYRVERNQDIIYASFNSPLELLTEVERGTRLDIIFLDVLMPAQNGISTAREIRQYDTSVKIIYLTSSAEYAVDSYSVGAYFYQLKPIWQESFYRLMDSVLSECHKDKENSLILRSRTGITRLDLDRLQYCEVMGRTLLFHRKDGEVLDSVGKLDDLCEQLDEGLSLLQGVRSDAAVWRMLPNLIAQPIINTRYLQKAVGLSKPQAERAIKTLSERGVVMERTGRQRSVAYEHRGILDVLDEYAAGLGRGEGTR